MCLLRWTQPSEHEALNQCWFDVGPASQIVGQHWTSIWSTLCFFGSVDMCFAPKRNNKFCLIHSLYQELYINQKSPLCPMWDSHPRPLDFVPAALTTRLWRSLPCLMNIWLWRRMSTVFADLLFSTCTTSVAFEECWIWRQLSSLSRP